ncbi:exonuclease domain-containing protein [Kitasatospora sp. NPDC056783]|uniref:exonuclease domain-containing protein n=1 Tax=Kitasatospora sp. NPDC056783 TaxID=3345943 RepID=UPI0036BAACA9
MSWWQQPLVGFDLETTGTDPAVDRIVTAALVDTVGADRVGAAHWLLDPGVPIPAEAEAIHGIGDEVARSKGRPAKEAVEEIAAALCERIADGRPVVAFNAPFYPRTQSASHVSHTAARGGLKTKVGLGAVR